MVNDAYLQELVHSKHSHRPSIAYAKLYQLLGTPIILNVDPKWSCLRIRREVWKGISRFLLRETNDSDSDSGSDFEPINRLRKLIFETEVSNSMADQFVLSSYLPIRFVDMHGVPPSLPPTYKPTASVNTGSGGGAGGAGVGSGGKSKFDELLAGYAATVPMADAVLGPSLPAGKGLTLGKINVPFLYVYTACLFIYVTRFRLHVSPICKPLIIMTLYIHIGDAIVNVGGGDRQPLFLSVDWTHIWAALLDTDEV